MRGDVPAVGNPLAAADDVVVVARPDRTAVSRLQGRVFRRRGNDGSGVTGRGWHVLGHCVGRDVCHYSSSINHSFGRRAGGARRGCQ